jgi:hypothetical protein
MANKAMLGAASSDAAMWVDADDDFLDADLAGIGKEKDKDGTVRRKLWVRFMDALSKRCHVG